MKVVKFASVGVINTLVSYSVFAVLVYIGQHYIIASVCSYITGVVTSYLLNARFTFLKVTCWQAFARFLLINSIALGFSVLVLHMFVVFAALNPLLAQIVVVVVRFPLMYFWVKRFVYHDNNSQ